MNRILLIQTRRLGDVVLSTALLEDLRRSGGAGGAVPVDFLVGAAAAPLLREHPLIAETIVVDESRLLELAGRLRERHYDLVVDVQGSTRTGLLARATGAPVRVGWRTRWWWLAYTRALPRGATHEYVVRERQRLLELAGITVHPALPHLQITLAERERGERELLAAGAPPGGARVGMLLSTREPAKVGRAESFAELAAALAAEGVMPIVFTTPGDETRAALVRAAAPRAVILPPLDLRRFLSVLATCRVLVSGDTGPAHMADALGVPRVTIFGPTSSVHWCPPVPTAIALRAPDAETVRLRDRARQVAEGRDFTGAISARMVLESVHTLLAGARVPERAAGAVDERRA